MGLALPGNIGLAEKLEPFAEQHGRGAIGIINMQGERRKPAGMRQQRTYLQVLTPMPAITALPTLALKRSSRTKLMEPGCTRCNLRSRGTWRKIPDLRMSSFR